MNNLHTTVTTFFQKAWLSFSGLETLQGVCVEISLKTLQLIECLYTGSGGGEGCGGLSLESQVKFPYIYESHNFLEPLLVTVNTYM